MPHPSQKEQPVNTPNGTNPLIQPPAGLLTPVTNPNTNQPDYAFPLQTSAWLKMQGVVTTALAFPLSSATFQDLYGTFTDEGSVETALTILGQINTTAAQYGDPQTLISSLPAFQQSDTPPSSIYGHAVWLAAQTQTTAQQIGALLNQGLTDIGQETDPAQRLQDLTELLTGQGGVNSYATALQDYISHTDPKTNKDTGFLGVVTDFYNELNPELTGQSNSLQWYLNQSSNVYTDAQNAVSSDQQQISQLNSQIKQLNDEYIGFTVAASVSPLLVFFPFFGILLAIADAATFGVLATQVKNQLGGLTSSLNSATEDEQKKAALVTALDGFNKTATDVEDDGQDFLTAIKTLLSGWEEFSSQITTRLNALTPDDLKNWGDFMQKLGFQTAIQGWQLIETKAEQFFQAGFVQFSTDTSSWLSAGQGESR
jgi:hypothetical protein